MNRRDLIKGIGAAIISAKVPPFIPGLIPDLAPVGFLPFLDAEVKKMMESQMRNVARTMYGGKPEIYTVVGDQLVKGAFWDA